jgi:predicted phage terminase large subunit-like protein
VSKPEPRPKLPSLEEIDAYLAEKSLHQFVRVSWPILHPTEKFVDGFHIQAICEHLEALFIGQIKNLLITVAPRSTKSVVSSICWPAWVWLHDPSFTFMFVSFASHLASDHSVKCRRVIESDWYQRNWSDRFRLTSDQNEKMKFTNDKMGTRAAFGMGGVTGMGAKAVICDDPNATEDWVSEAKLKTAINTYNSAVRNRVNDPNDARRLIIMQRISAQDLAGEILKEGGWEYLMLPTQYEPNRSKMTSIGWKDPRKKPGELLCPQRFNQVEVDALKTKPRIFQAQHQQNPSNDEGAIFKRGFWRYYSETPQQAAAMMDTVIISMDAAFKDFKTGSMVALHVWGKKGSNKYLLERRTEHLDFNASVKALALMCQAWPMAKAKIVEDKANGPAIINSLRDHIAGIIPWPPPGMKMDSKVGRALAQQPQHESGNLWLPNPAMVPWVNEVVDLMVEFPEGDYDDDVDAMVQALQRFERTEPKVMGAPMGIGQVAAWI